MTGPLSCPLGHGTLEAEATHEMVDIKGLGVAVVDPSNGFKISEIEIYYDQNEIMKQLVCLLIKLHCSTSIVASFRGARSVIACCAGSQEVPGSSGSKWGSKPLNFQLVFRGFSRSPKYGIKCISQMIVQYLRYEVAIVWDINEAAACMLFARPLICVVSPKYLPACLTHVLAKRSSERYSFSRRSTSLPLMQMAWKEWDGF